ncbi:hypothetical protein [uncultured Croceitalea sp.]|uniref:hypothetical protein n=1 Tax=uncultured Croceitalea sp. TaxID=1798908 RepID=UPI003305EDAC
MKLRTLFLTVLTLNFAYSQNNLLNFPGWNVGPAGAGYTNGYSISGSSAENALENGLNPYGDTSVLWKATPDNSGVTNGGFYTNSVSIVANKTYRFSIWLKKTGTQTGKSYFGLHARDASSVKTTLNFDGSTNNNPYFWSDDLQTLDEWYLVVAFIHGDGYAANVNHPDTGIYATDGSKLSGVSITDFKLSANSVNLQLRAYLNYDTVLTDNQFFYAPAIHEVNGQEPSIAQLIDPNASNSGSTVWNANGGDINYVSGNVGIGTTSIPVAYALAVDGKILSEEVRVQISDSWPDYVFDKDYNLPSLSEIQKYILENGHLPNLPSAKEVEQKGIEVGNMNKLLLEKIEELTLYIINQEKRIKELELKSLQSKK